MPRITAAERRRQEAAARDRAVYAALAWPEEPCPQPWSNDHVRDLGAPIWGHAPPVRAWTYNAYSRRVTHGSFNATSHSPDDSVPRSQTRGGPWFATESEARLAMRWAMCREMAETLHQLVEAEAKAIVRETATA